MFIRERINNLYNEALVKANEGDQIVPNLFKSRITGDDFIEQITPFGR